MAATKKILDQMRREPANVRFADLKKVCEEYFDKGKAKPYQVRQVLLAIQRLEDIHNAN